MPHSARQDLALTIQDASFTLDEADALLLALRRSRSRTPALLALRSALADTLAGLEWTRVADTPQNFTQLARLLKRAQRVSDSPVGTRRGARTTASRTGETRQLSA
jgi:hypothetical protein